MFKDEQGYIMKDEKWSRILIETNKTHVPAY
jgi:hypothetical protein